VRQLVVRVRQLVLVPESARQLVVRVRQLVLVPESVRQLVVRMQQALPVSARQFPFLALQLWDLLAQSFFIPSDIIYYGSTINGQLHYTVQRCCINVSRHR